ncbi:MAG TPA: IPTL-CTERM sorting domain-containing protein, partial [Thermoanaerobaculia bacterium]|nr:IPTL-CTERM sorting domain-containing protein [Thermoanaerobaculia bacterium]
TDGVTSVNAGGSVTYTIVAANAGPSNATGATVADTFPASLTCTWTCVGAGGGTCTASGSGNINDTVNLPNGGSVTYTASCTLSNAATGTLTNTATVAAPAGVTDPTPGNNSATDSDTIVAAAVGASVSGTKTAAGTFTVGSTITYTVILSNAGPGAQADNPGNEFTDVLPATLALVSATATSGTASTSTNTVTWNGAIPASGSVTITITATILPAAAGTTVSNQGTISYDADGNGTNEATAQTDDPGVAGAANPTSIPVAGGPGPNTIPTLSTLGLALLALVLAGLAFAMLKRRRSA